MGSGASKRKSPAASGDRRGETAAAFVHRSQRQELVDQRPSQSPAASHTGDRTPTFQTASVSSSVPRGHSSPDMPRNCTVCSDCSLKIGLFKKKHKCEHCKDYFCDMCFSKSSALLPAQHAPLKHCVQCNMRRMSVFRRDQLFLLSIKHLRHFLTTKDIAIEQCTEKYHLVDLIMQFAERNGQKSMTDIAREEMRQMEVEMMRQEELRRQQEEEARRRQQEPQSTSSDAQGSPIIADTSPSSSKTQYKSSRQRFKSVEDLTSEEDIQNLTVLELKQILTVNFINYRGCVEKHELVERVRRLWEEQKRRTQYEGSASTSTSTEDYERDLCKICMDNMIDCVLLDCGHLVTCTKCGKRLAECPVCRQLVVKVVHVFRA